MFTALSRALLRKIVKAPVVAYKPTVRGRAARLTLRAVAWVVLNLVVLEAATRVYFAAQVGPRVLFYGTPWHRKSVAPTPGADAKDPWWWSPQSHHNNIGDYHSYTPGSSAYSKYFPYNKKWIQSPDGRERFPVRINNHGFRGEDYTVEKAPGTVRTLTLGASSTFFSSASSSARGMERPASR